VNEAREAARELMQVGQLLNDPRSTGFGLGLFTWIALISESYAEALELSEQSEAVAVTPFDRAFAITGKGCALVLLRRTDEGARLLEEQRRQAVTDGYLYALNGSDPAIGLCKVLQGNIANGIQWIEDAILRREHEGYRANADWYRGFLIEIYLQIISGNEKLPLSTLLRNLPVLLRVTISASSRIRALIARIQENTHFDQAGNIAGRAQMHLGLLYKIKRKPLLAVHHLTEAKRIFSQFGQTPVLARVETALAELGQ
jgi:hypothetical protein